MSIRCGCQQEVLAHDRSDQSSLIGLQFSFLKTYPFSIECNRCIISTELTIRIVHALNNGLQYCKSGAVQGLSKVTGCHWKSLATLLHGLSQLLCWTISQQLNNQLPTLAITLPTLWQSWVPPFQKAAAVSQFAVFLLIKPDQAGRRKFLL